MPGYANRTIRFDFPDLTEDGDTPIHVVIKNPRTLPVEELAPNVGDEASGVDTLKAMYPVIASMIKAWHVYDGTSDADDLPPLPLPATAESVAKLPFEILNKISEAIKGVVAPGN